MRHYTLYKLAWVLAFFLINFASCAPMNVETSIVPTTSIPSTTPRMPTATFKPTATILLQNTTSTPIPLGAYPVITTENVNRLKIIASWEVSDIGGGNNPLWYPDSQQFIVLNEKDKDEDNFSIRLYNIESQQETLLINNADPMLMSPDSKYIFFAVHGELMIYDLSGKFIKHITMRPPCDYAVFFDVDWMPQSNIIFFGKTEGKITYNASIFGFDTNTGKCLGKLFASDGAVRFLKGNPSGDLLAAGISREVKILDIKTKKQVCTIPGTHALFKSSKEIIVADNLETGKLASWDVKTCKMIQEFDGRLDVYYSNMAININSQLIVVGNRDLTFLDVNSGKELNTYKAAGDPFAYPSSMDLAFSPDGRFLASTQNLGKDKQKILVWGIEP